MTPGFSSPAGRPSGNQPSQMPTIPKPEKVEYLRNDHLREELVDVEAQNWAERFKDVKPTQLRRFYEHVLALKRRLDESPNPQQLFEAIRAEFKMLKAKAVYTAGRNNKLQPLLQFFVNHTAAVKTLKDFEAFLKHFEAVVAFHKFYGEGTR